METTLITLTANNCTAKAISHKNNVLINMFESDGRTITTIVMNKKYFNQISAYGKVEGRIRTTDDGLIIFEGFSFR